VSFGRALVFVHIFDYVGGDYCDLGSLRGLILQCNEIGCFPLCRAKNEGLRDLLKVLFGGR
jgi:hypothetical protein